MAAGMARKIDPKVKLALEFGPLILFFAMFFWLKDTTFTVGGISYKGFIAATAAFIPVMLISTGLLWRLTGRLSPMQVMTLALVIVMGGLSVWFNDERFFKMKPTIIYLFFAGVLGFGLLRGQSYLSYAMDSVLPLSPEGWTILTRRVMFLFLGLAALNEAVWRTMSDQAWVTFKTFGLMAATFAFFMTQGKLLEKHGIPDGKDEG